MIIKNISDSIVDLTFVSDGTLIYFSMKQDVALHSKSPAFIVEKSDINLKAGSMDHLALNSESESESGSEKAGVQNSINDMILETNYSAASQNGDSVRSVKNERMEAELAKIDELQLRPGSEKTIEVHYQPERGHINDIARASRLHKKAFKFHVSFSKHGSRFIDKKTIQCKSKVCTSFIEVSQKLLSFGDVDVKEFKTLQQTIKNLSDLPTRVEFRYISKILSSIREEITIPPNQSVEAALNIYPLKVNPDYRKIINVTNLLNRDNDQAFEVRASNIDQARVSFHSLFYRVSGNAFSNFIDFGNVVVNAPSLRVFKIENISKQNLSLRLSSSSDNISTFVLKEKFAVTLNKLEGELSIRRKRIIDAIEVNHIRSKTYSEFPLHILSKAKSDFVSDALVDLEERKRQTDYLDLASPKIAQESKGIQSIPDNNIQPSPASGNATINDSISIDRSTEYIDIDFNNISYTIDDIFGLLGEKKLNLTTILNLYTGLCGQQPYNSLFKNVVDSKLAKIFSLLTNEYSEAILMSRLIAANDITLAPGEVKDVYVQQCAIDSSTFSNVLIFYVY